MGKRLIVLAVAMVLFAVVQGQQVESKKCKTCGKPLKECQYKGKHPQNSVNMDGNNIVFVVDGTEYRYKMVYVSGGSFNMGGAQNDSSITSYATKDCTIGSPIHSVYVPNFYVGQTDVPQALWRAVMGKRQCQHAGCYGKKQPVDEASWEEIQSFITRLNAITGRKFRLPTEEEWEFAARGGNSGRGYKYSGSDNINDVAWYRGNVDERPRSVAQKKPNEIGLYDMSGNVGEWCANCWRDNYYSEEDCSCHVFRGGGWYDSDEGCSPTGRYKHPGHNHRGFRLALSH